MVPAGSSVYSRGQNRFYLQPEGPSWPNPWYFHCDGKPIDRFLHEETERMAARYGNYASFCMMAAGNKPAQDRNQAKIIRDFVRYWQQRDQRRVYTGASVAMSQPLVPENDYMVKIWSAWIGLEKQCAPEQSQIIILHRKVQCTIRNNTKWGNGVYSGF